MPSLTDAKINGRSIKGATLTPADANARITYYVGDKPVKGYVTDYLYRDNPGQTAKQAALRDNRLPSPLTPGTFHLAAKRSGETDADYVRWACRVIAASKPDHAGDPVPQNPPGEGTSTPVPSHLIKGIVTDELLAADTPIVRMDGTTVTMKQMLAVWGTKVARLWYSYEPGKPPDAGRIAKKIQWCRDNGIPNLILCVTPKQGLDVKPAADQTTSFFAALLPLITGKGVTVRVELGNEPNQPTYWRWPLASLVPLFIAPACGVLHAKGIDTIGASPTGDVNAVRTLRAAGMACDAQGFHPYRTSAADLRAMLAALVSVTGNQPIDLTEFNAYVGKQVASGEIKPAAAVAIQLAQWAEVRGFPTVRFVCDYAMIVIGTPTSTSPLALLRQDNDGTIRETVFSRDYWAVVA